MVEEIPGAAQKKEIWGPWPVPFPVFFLSPHLRFVAWATIAIGLVLRILPNVMDPQKSLVSCIANANWILAQSVAAGNGFVFPQTTVLAHCTLEAGPSHHWGPLMPLFESAFVIAFGPSLATLNAALITLSCLTIFSAYLATRNLYGGAAGLLVAAAVSVEWSTVVFGSRLGYSENLVFLTFMVTLWAILRSLRDERFILLAGFFAGLGYLAKASMGWFFLLAGLGGLAWRVHHHGLGAVRNRWYLGAIAIFGVFVGSWSARNLANFWDGTPAGLWVDWQTSAYNAYVFGQAFSHPGQFLLGLAQRIPVMVLGICIPIAFLGRSIASQGWLRRRHEDATGLLLAAALILVLGWLFAGAYWVVEQTPLWWADPIRYVAPAIIPLLWLAMGSRAQPPFAGWAFLYSSSIVSIGVSRFFL